MNKLAIVLLALSMQSFADDQVPVWEYYKDYNHIQYMKCGNVLYSEQPELTLWLNGSFTTVQVQNVVNYWHLNYLAGKYGEPCI